MSFRDLALARLGKYKTDILHIQEDGIFRYRGREIPKAHILPKGKEQLNILEPYRQRFFSPACSRIQLHQYFHHLNSSQALCLNLFLPLKEENKLGMFLDYLKMPSTGDVHSEFERKSTVEQNADRLTSFDFYLQNAAGEVYVEAKYTEDGFGRAKNDAEHRKKHRLTYLPLLKKGSRYLVQSCQDETVFLRHYQVLRNLVHVGETASVVLLFPAGNERVTKEAAYAREHFLTEAGREKLKIVHLEDLLARLDAAFTGSPLGEYYRTFREKYSA